ncbi:MAG: hypothetical protein ACXADH_17565 [Candidatus Kariarchaeaceae archaeon]|jgi:hypothetical protein
MKKGDRVIISGEAVGDSELPSNEANVVRLFEEAGTNNPIPYELVELKFDDGSTGVVGQHEVKVKGGKVAKLVYFSLMTRVIVDEGATEDEIIASTYANIQDKIDNRELGDNLEEIDDDTECPYGTFDGEV